MNTKKSSFTLIKRYGMEYLLTGIFGIIPTPIGKMLRNIIYRLFFGKVGKSVYIQPNVRFIGTDTIEIGDYVRIYSGTYISNKGNRIHFGHNVSIECNKVVTLFGIMGSPFSCELQRLSRESRVAPDTVVFAQSAVEPLPWQFDKYWPAVVKKFWRGPKFQTNEYNFNLELTLGRLIPSNDGMSGG